MGEVGDHIPTFHLFGGNLQMLMAINALAALVSITNPSRLQEDVIEISGSGKVREWRQGNMSMQDIRRRNHGTSSRSSSMTTSKAIFSNG
ncbi:hypothetical protein CR513_59836, partial [Mucuna pruriens]